MIVYPPPPPLSSKLQPQRLFSSFWFFFDLLNLQFLLVPRAHSPAVSHAYCVGHSKEEEANYDILCVCV